MAAGITCDCTTDEGYGDLAFQFLYVGREGVASDNASNLGLLYMQARHYIPALGALPPARPDRRRGEPLRLRRQQPRHEGRSERGVVVAVAQSAAGERRQREV